MRVRLYFRPMAIIDDAAFFTIPIVQCSRRLAFNPSAAATKPPPPTRSVRKATSKDTFSGIDDGGTREGGGRKKERATLYSYPHPPLPTERPTDLPHAKMSALRKKDSLLVEWVRTRREGGGGGEMPLS